MITITEKQSKKIPGGTSLFVEFNYSPNIVEIIKQVTVANYDKKTHVWEVPCVDLAYLLNNLSSIDDITLTTLSDNNIIEENKPVTLPKFKTDPFDYQKDGIIYGLQHDKFLLLDAPGLGKTLQILYIAEELYNQGKVKHCLIICGVNTLKTNWKKEIEKHSKLSCKILGEKVSKKGVYSIGSVKERVEQLTQKIDEFFVITNIETIRSDDIVKQINSGVNDFDMVVLDECHVCKSPTADQTKNLLKLTNAKYKIGATGTVIINNPLDAYVPLKWIGAETCNYTNFKYFYCNFGGPFNNMLLGFRNVDVLKSMLSEVSLRRTKDMLKLPPKNIIHEFVDMNDQQSLFYNNIVKGITDQVDKVELNTSTIFSMCTRLRQAAVCPSMLTSENIKSSKIERAEELIQEIIDDGEKVVVFSLFKEPLNIMLQDLQKYNPLLCTGDIKDNIVSENIDKFQTDDTYKVMLCTTAKMGVGITLTAATNAIFIDSTWTQAGNLQCEDRIYRIGSNKPVFIYYLWAANTFDEHVKEIVEDKSLIGDYIVDNQLPSNLTDRLRKLIVDL